jgi:asparagine synthase (glutamine-hydrolysing)
MCGISGYIKNVKLTQSDAEALKLSVQQIKHRGPDAHKVDILNNIGLAHARLSIIDTTENANQPFYSDDNTFVIVYNGEIYNYNELKEDLLLKGYVFRTKSDTEVLLKLYIEYGEECLQKLDGFFAFAIFNQNDNSLFIARDRFGIKPFFYSVSENTFSFSSELQGIIRLLKEKTINRVALFAYLQLNYIPAPETILNNVNKLLPGHCILIKNCQFPQQYTIKQYYSIEAAQNNTLITNAFNYKHAQNILKDLLHQSVKNRLIADVPVGAFLSGGIDSSIIATIAAKYHKNLQTFSIGYADNPYFDETSYAELVANKIGSKHYTLSLTTQDLITGAKNVLEAIDEPFADSSEIAVFLLTKFAKEKITVALSGDGADEIFSGYHKHKAEFLARNPSITEKFIQWGFPVWKKLPKSRNNKFTNLNRQLYKFALGMHLPNKQRYWKWATVQPEEFANYLIKEPIQFNNPQRLSDDAHKYKKLQSFWLKPLTKNNDFNRVLLTDLHFVLPNDMLTKVDMMSMANSLEVRVPFLQHRIVEFAFSLPSAFKINRNIKKKILQDAFRNELPEELYNRPKKGFEVPLHTLLTEGLKDYLNEFLSEDFILKQNIFNPQAIKFILNKLNSNNPEDSAATVWAILVFNFWWKKNFTF